MNEANLFVLAVIMEQALLKHWSFRANDELIALEPVCVLTLTNTLNPDRGAEMQSFGPALNLGQKASEKGIRHQVVKARA